MAFVPKTAEQIQQTFLNNLQAVRGAPITDYNVGSVIRLLGEAQSALIEEFNAELTEAIAQAIQSVLMNAVGFPPLTATRAYGQIQITNSTSSSQTITAGTLVTIPNSALQFQFAATVTVPTNNTISAVVIATVPGTIGNAPANTITQFVNPMNGLTITNPRAFITGKNDETEDERLTRFQNFLNLLRRGDKGALEAGALTVQLLDDSGYAIEQVTKTVAVDSATPGIATLYVYNGIGSMSSNLMTQVQNVVNGYTDAQGVAHIGYKAAGVQSNVVDATALPQTVAMAIYPLPGYTLDQLQGSLVIAVQNVFDNLDIGDPLRISDLVFAVRAVPGVGNAQATTPNADVPGVTGQIITLSGTPSFTLLSY